MKPKISVFVATSLDGFVARHDGSLDWLDKANKAVPKGEDCGFQNCMNSIDVLVMGRVTFEQVLTFGEWPYGEKAVVVMSSREIKIPAHFQKTVSISSESPVVLVERLFSRGAKHLYVDGGMTIQNFLQADLIDEVTITLIPLVLGEGKPLFKAIGKDIALIHLNTKSFDFGFVQVKYGIKKDSSQSYNQ